MNFFLKAMERGLNPANIFSWTSLEIMRVAGSFCGTIRLYLKAWLLGVNIGKAVKAHGKVGLLRWPGGKIEIGDQVSLISSWRRATASALAFPVRLRVFGIGAEIRIGTESQLSGTSITARSKKISIGNKVLIGPNCIITDSDFHQHWPAVERIDSPGYEKDADVNIADNVWIGMNSIILKGSRIGEGAIIGAGSVVTGHIPPCCVACGNPAKVIRYYDPEQSQDEKK